MVFFGDGLVLSLGSRMKKKEGKEVIEKRGGNRKDLQRKKRGKGGYSKDQKTQGDTKGKNGYEQTHNK